MNVWLENIFSEINQLSSLVALTWRQKLTFWWKPVTINHSALTSAAFLTPLHLGERIFFSSFFLLIDTSGICLMITLLIRGTLLSFWPLVARWIDVFFKHVIIYFVSRACSALRLIAAQGFSLLHRLTVNNANVLKRCSGLLRDAVKKKTYVIVSR